MRVAARAATRGLKLTTGADPRKRRSRLFGMADLLFRGPDRPGMLVSRRIPTGTFWRSFPDGIVKTFEVTLMSIACALIVGLITGVGRISKIAIINRIATIYVRLFAGFPSWYKSSTSTVRWRSRQAIRHLRSRHSHDGLLWGLPGRDFRAGTQSIHKGQMEAIALGLTRGQALRESSCRRHSASSPAAGQRVHRPAEGLLPRVDPRRLGSPVPRTGSTLRRHWTTSRHSPWCPRVPGDDAVLLAPRGTDGGKDEPPWQIGCGSSMHARTSARSLR